MLKTVTFHTDEDGLTMALGPREAVIMDVLWNEPDRWRTVEQVCRRMEDVAITTTQTTLNRMVDKGLVLREARSIGRRRRNINHYRPVYATEDALRRHVELIVTEGLRVFMGKERSCFDHDQYIHPC